VGNRRKPHPWLREDRLLSWTLIPLLYILLV
jgi:hypothetical protein